jgi:hypothetical protein
MSNEGDRLSKSKTNKTLLKEMPLYTVVGSHLIWPVCYNNFRWRQIFNSQEISLLGESIRLCCRVVYLTCLQKIGRAFSQEVWQASGHSLGAQPLSSFGWKRDKKKHNIVHVVVNVKI